MVDWDLYRYFLVVAREGSLSAAARDLGTSQPTVGRHISRLESQLGVRLFDRVAKEFRLTAAGASVLDTVKRMEQEGLAAERRLLGQDTRVSGSVRLSLTEGLAVHWLIPLLPDFRTRFPDIELDIATELTAVSLTHREADVALRLNRAGSENVVGRRAGDVGFGLYTAEAYAAGNGTPDSMADLAAHQIIGISGELAHSSFAGEVPHLLSSGHMVLRSSNLMVHAAAVQAGLGIGVLACVVGDRLPGVKRLLRKDFGMRTGLWLLTHRDLRTAARVRCVLDYLAEALRRDRALFAGEG
jgi:DNA-binding transcriptional LysR family regulator